MSGLLTAGTVIEHLFPLFHQPGIADMALFGLIQFFFLPAGSYGQEAARASRFCGSMSGETANKGTGDN